MPNDPTLNARVADLRSIFDTSVVLTPGATVYMAHCELVRLRDFDRENKRWIETLNDELISRGAEIHRLAEELKSRTVERDHARQEWYAWMKLAVGNGVSLGEAHMLPIDGKG
jgi:hypothetical protein